MDAAAWTLRRADEADLGRIVEIGIAGWRHAYRGILPDAWLDTLDPATIAERRAASLAEPAPTRVLVATSPEDTGRALGFVIVRASPHPERDGHPEMATGELSTLYVDPPSIGTGIGAALHDAGLAHLRDAGFARVVLWVFAENTPAIAFYRRRGWQVDSAPWNPGDWGASAVRLRLTCANR